MVDRIQLVSGEGRLFNASEMYVALRKCVGVKYVPVFMPEIINSRNKFSFDSGVESIDAKMKVWTFPLCTASLVATWKTKQGSPVVVVAHVSNYFSVSENVANAKQHHGAGILPPGEFYRLVDIEDGRNVFVVDYNLLLKFQRKHRSMDPVPVDVVFEHPLFVPYTGAVGAATDYLEKNGGMHPKGIGIPYGDVPMDVPVGRLLYLGHAAVNTFDSSRPVTRGGYLPGLPVNSVPCRAHGLLEQRVS